MSGNNPTPRGAWIFLGVVVGLMVIFLLTALVIQAASGASDNDIGSAMGVGVLWFLVVPGPIIAVVGLGIWAVVRANRRNAERQEWARRQWLATLPPPPPGAWQDTQGFWHDPPPAWPYAPQVPPQWPDYGHGQALPHQSAPPQRSDEWGYGR